ncbi:hypothetical protein SKAU_G00124220 [Synaphobranchus kaupii]|uniref:Uncharacterized protein n=1 Tax=Synaphobranchus kaupii TaxID=118154 RepID=A0A9Q1J2C3_SYNKA|nr:hypothetical protein SKAU_G00124220 [Synaphobranchus kaupii]
MSLSTDGSRSFPKSITGPTVRTRSHKPGPERGCGYCGETREAQRKAVQREGFGELGHRARAPVGLPLIRRFEKLLGGDILETELPFPLSARSCYHRRISLAGFKWRQRNLAPFVYQPLREGDVLGATARGPADPRKIKRSKIHLSYREGLGGVPYGSPGTASGRGAAWEVKHRAKSGQGGKMAVAVALCEAVAGELQLRERHRPAGSVRADNESELHSIPLTLPPSPDAPAVPQTRVSSLFVFLPLSPSLHSRLLPSLLTPLLTSIHLPSRCSAFQHRSLTLESSEEILFVEGYRPPRPRAVPANGSLITRPSQKATEGSGCNRSRPRRVCDERSRTLITTGTPGRHKAYPTAKDTGLNTALPAMSITTEGAG